MIYGIGYGNLTPEQFIQILVDNNIKVLIDIRAKPEWARLSSYKQKGLQRMLDEKGIIYIHEVKLGNTSRKLEDFSVTIDMINIAENYLTLHQDSGNIVFLCACKYEERCHRGLLFNELRATHEIKPITY